MGTVSHAQVEGPGLLVGQLEATLGIGAPHAGAFGAKDAHHEAQLLEGVLPPGGVAPYAGPFDRFAQRIEDDAAEDHAALEDQVRKPPLACSRSALLEGHRTLQDHVPVSADVGPQLGPHPALAQDAEEAVVAGFSGRHGLRLRRTLRARGGQTHLGAGHGQTILIHHAAEQKRRRGGAGAEPCHRRRARIASTLRAQRRPAASTTPAGRGTALLPLTADLPASPGQGSRRGPQAPLAATGAAAREDRHERRGRSHERPRQQADGVFFLGACLHGIGSEVALAADPILVRRGHAVQRPGLRGGGLGYTWASHSLSGPPTTPPRPAADLRRNPLQRCSPPNGSPS